MSCASRTGSSCPTYSGDGSSEGLCSNVAVVPVLVLPEFGSAALGSVNTGELVAATNGDRLGSVAGDDSTSRVSLEGFLRNHL